MFRDGLATITRMTGWPSLGILPWFSDAHRLPAEDALDIVSKPNPGAALKVAVPILPRIANFDDLDPLRLDPSIALAMVPAGTPIPPADLIVLPGSKSTIADLAFVRSQGWDIDIKAHRRRGGHVLGLCGGYQMLGRSIADPEGFEGPPGSVEALGLLAVDTVLTADKTVRPVVALHEASRTRVEAYEIHLGRTHGADTRHAPFTVGDGAEGAASPDGRVIGTYLHGLFAADAFRAAFLNDLRPDAAFLSPSYDAGVEQTLDSLASHFARHLDVDAILAIARGGL